MAKTSGGGGSVKRPRKAVKKAMPKIANKGGAVRGQQRAAQVQSAPRPRTPSLPKSPAVLKNTPVPQWQLFGGITDRIAQVTGQGEGTASPDSLMPFKSTKQRKFMHAKHPVIAKRWENEAKAAGKPAVTKRRKKK